MNIPEALEMRLRAKRRDQKHRWYKKDCEYSQSFLRGSSAANKHVGSVSVEAPLVGKTGGVPCSSLASVIYDSFSMQRTRAIQETTEASGEGSYLIEEAIRKIKNRAPEVI